MGMSIEENELVVAKIIANDSKAVKPLAIRVKDFNVRSLADNEVEVSLERLKRIDVIKEYKHCWGFFTKDQEGVTFEFTGITPKFKDQGDEDDERMEQEVYSIDFNSVRLTKYLDSKRVSILNTVIPKMIEKRGEDFYCNNKRIPFDSNESQYYHLFDILYGDNGESKLLNYETINKELISKGEQRIEERTAIIQRIRNAVNNGLYYRVDKSMLKKYVKIKNRVGVEFINPPRQ